MLLLALRDDEQVFAFSPIAQGLLRLANSSAPLANNMIPAALNSRVECWPNHFICGNADTKDANIAPMPSITKRLGNAQHIKVEKEVNKPSQFIAPEVEIIPFVIF